MPDLEAIVATDKLKIARLRSNSGRSGNALVSFTGVGHALNGMDIQRPEFFRAHQSYGTMLFVTDLQRSWGNNICMEELATTIGELTDGAEIDTLGNSMGGFLSLIAPHWLSVRRSVAFVPQVSVHPDIATWETRWIDYRKNITSWQYPSAAEYLNDSTEYVIVTGDDSADLRQVSLLPNRPNLKLLQIPAFAHEVAKGLKNNGLLDECVIATLNHDAPERWLNQELLPRLAGAPSHTETKSQSRSILRATGTQTSS